MPCRAGCGRNSPLSLSLSLSLSGFFIAVSHTVSIVHVLLGCALMSQPADEDPFADFSWFDRVLIEIYSDPIFYFGWLGVCMLPLFCLSLWATSQLIKEELKEMGARDSKKKRRGRQKEENTNHHKRRE